MMNSTTNMMNSTKRKTRNVEDPDEWTRRMDRYAIQAREDFAMYARLEAQGKLLSPKRAGALRKSRKAKVQK